MMTQEEFRDGIERWGARLESWPEAQRQDARALIGQDSLMASLLAEAEALDRLLDRAPAPAPSAALLGRIMAEADSSQQTTSRGIAGWVQNVWTQSAVLAAAGAIGLMVGLVEAAEVTDETDLFAPQYTDVSGVLESWFEGEGE